MTAIFAITSALRTKLIILFLSKSKRYFAKKIFSVVIYEKDFCTLRSTTTNTTTSAIKLVTVGEIHKLQQTQI